eukprot:TRINITY_DN44597_c0_g1_i1.p1 TRINITY_DN44597_c0_g1~~TRINITY_DN44597_c0_g1_i1.p1  ORF type:complete len:533 (-),score=78.85 TRINITY_DN44597_c0_g1_i1:97-1695(-)
MVASACGGTSSPARARGAATAHAALSRPGSNSFAARSDHIFGGLSNAGSCHGASSRHLGRGFVQERQGEGEIGYRPSGAMASQRVPQRRAAASTLDTHPCLQCRRPQPLDSSARSAVVLRRSLFAPECDHGPFCQRCRCRVASQVLPTCVCRALIIDWLPPAPWQKSIGPQLPSVEQSASSEPELAKPYTEADRLGDELLADLERAIQGFEADSDDGKIPVAHAVDAESVGMFGSAASHASSGPVDCVAAISAPTDFIGPPLPPNGAAGYGAAVATPTTVGSDTTPTLPMIPDCVQNAAGQDSPMPLVGATMRNDGSYSNTLDTISSVATVPMASKSNAANGVPATSAAVGLLSDSFDGNEGDRQPDSSLVHRELGGALGPFGASTPAQASTRAAANLLSKPGPCKTARLGFVTPAMQAQLFGRRDKGGKETEPMSSLSTGAVSATSSSVQAGTAGLPVVQACVDEEEDDFVDDSGTEVAQASSTQREFGSSRESERVGNSPRFKRRRVVGEGVRRRPVTHSPSDDAKGDGT